MNLSEQATASHPAKSSSLPASMAPNICATTYCADFSHVIWWASGRTSAHVFSPVTCHPFLLVGLWRDSYIDLLYIFPNWVVESPTYTAKNQGFGHCSNGDWQDRTHIISWDLETHQLQLSGGFLKNWKNVVNAHKKSDLRWQKTDLSSQGMEGILSFRFFFRSKATKKKRRPWTFAAKRNIPPQKIDPTWLVFLFHPDLGFYQETHPSFTKTFKMQFSVKTKGPAERLKSQQDSDVLHWPLRYNRWPMKHPSPKPQCRVSPLHPLTRPHDIHAIALERERERECL